MSRRRTRRRSATQGTLGFFRIVLTGPYGPLERARRIAGNLWRRRTGTGCCGNYGEPGC
jgi:hypothetical protein